MTVVSNTSPITSLAAVGQLNLLQQLYSNIIILQAVYDEMTDLGYPVPGTIEVQTLSWIQTQQIIDRTEFSKNKLDSLYGISVCQITYLCGRSRLKRLRRLSNLLLLGCYS